MKGLKASTYTYWIIKPTEGYARIAFRARPGGDGVHLSPERRCHNPSGQPMAPAVPNQRKGGARAALL